MSLSPRLSPAHGIGHVGYLGLLLGGAGLLLVVWLSFGLVASDRFPIRWVQVEGPFRYVSASQVRSTVAPFAESGYFAADLGAIQQALEAHPWIARASVRKSWPDLLEVEVVEHRPMARWKAGGLIDVRGEHFQVPAGLGPGQLPTLSGPDEARDEVVATWIELRELLRPIDLDVRSLTLEQRGAWSMRTDNGIELMLGREDLSERVSRFVGIYRQLHERQQVSQIERVDLRYPNGVSVRWKDSMAAGGPAEQQFRSQR